MDLSRDLMLQLTKTWLHLNKVKRIPLEIVRERITREDLEKSSRRPTDETIRKVLKENGFYDIKIRLLVEEIKALDLLVDLGYVDRYQDKIHKAYFGYQAIPYILDIYPSGEISLRSNVKEINENIDLLSDQYQKFYNSGKKLCSQIKNGMHGHIQSLNFGEKFHNETTIYELKDKYFDSLSIVPLERERSIKIFLVEPVVQSQNSKKFKNWKHIREISLQDFLTDRQKIDKLIDNEFKWKKSKDGIIIHKNYDYDYNLLITQEQNTPYEGVLAYPTLSDFLEGNNYSIENIFSRMFEDETALFINEIHRESCCYVQTRIKPEYLTGKEIDVFAYVSKEPSQIIVCECKFRQKNIEVPIGTEEIDDFYEKATIIKNNEKANHPQSHLKFWFVTNSVTMNDNLLVYSKDRGIELKKAVLSTDWRTDPKWRINNLVDVA